MPEQTQKTPAKPAAPKTDPVSEEKTPSASDEQNDDQISPSPDPWQDAVSQIESAGFTPEAAVAILTSTPAATQELQAEPVLCIGRIVYYWREDKASGRMKVYPAIVTAVGEDDEIAAVTFATPFGSAAWRERIPKGGPQTSHSWSWPVQGAS